MLLLAATNQLMLDGFEAWAGVLGGGTAFATGLVALLVANAGGEGDYLADQINKALGRGFLYGGSRSEGGRGRGGHWCKHGRPPRGPA